MAEEEEGIDSSLCVICQEENGNELRESKTGIPSLIQYASIFELEQLKTYLIARQQENASVNIHMTCQKNIGNTIRKRKRDDKFNLNTQTKAQKMSTRASIEKFNWKAHCLFCGDISKVDPKHPGRRPVYNVTIIHYRETILKYCDCRKDEWASEVKRRVINCIDLVQEARYHDDCRKRFTEAEKDKSSIRPRGRPKGLTEENNFEMLCQWLETEGELYSLVELHDKMKEFAQSDDIYSRKWFKTKIKEKYDDMIFFAEIVNGRCVF